MDPTKDILQAKQPELTGRAQQSWAKLTDADLARLSNKREELILILRQWHGYSRGRADRAIRHWLYNHGESNNKPSSPTDN